MRQLGETLRSLITDSAWYMWSKVIPGLSGLAFVMLFVRWLGEEEYGRYAVAVSAATLGAGFSSGWLNQAALRYFGEDWWSTPATRKALAAGLGLSILVGAAAIGGASLIRSGGEGLVSLSEAAGVLLLLASLSVFQLRVALIQARLRPGSVVAVTAGQALLGLALPFGMTLLSGRHHLALLFGLALSNGLMALAGREAAGNPGERASSPNRLATESTVVLRRLWAFGWALSCWLAVVAAMPLIERFLIGERFGYAAAGAYAALYDLVMRSFSLLSHPVTMAAHPRIMRLWSAGSHEEARATWRLAMRAQAGVFVGVLLGALVLGDWAVAVVLPASALAAAPALLPLLFAGFAWQLALLAHKPFEVDGRTSWMLGIAVISLCVATATNLVLLPRWGPIAAAYSYGFAGILYCGLIVLAARGLGCGLAVGDPPAARMTSRGTQR